HVSVAEVNHVSLTFNEIGRIVARGSMSQLCLSGAGYAPDYRGHRARNRTRIDRVAAQGYRDSEPARSRRSRPPRRCIGQRGGIGPIRLRPLSDNETPSVWSSKACSMWSVKDCRRRSWALEIPLIYSYIAQGMFPRQRRLGLRCVGWLASEGRGFGLGAG